jgi:hypothetical protein
MQTLLFLVLLVVTFFVVLLMTKPTKQETDIGRRLAGFDQVAANRVIDQDILKRDVLSGLPILNAMLQRVKLAADIDILIKQANSSWTVGGCLFGALVAFVVIGVVSGVWFHSIPAGVILGLVAANWPYVFMLIKRKARMNRFAVILI